MDIIGTIVYLILTLVFIGAIFVISYVSYDYFNYKNDTITKINNTMTNIDTNKLKIDEITKSSSNLDLSFQTLTKTVTNKDLLMDTIDTTVKTNTSNISTFDANLKNFFTFSNNDSNINTGLFEYYMFGSDSKKSLDLISKTTAIAGMTINTDGTDNTLDICDAANKANCIKMNNIDGNFMISPSNDQTNNIIFQNMNADGGKGTVLKVDLKNKTTYFNSNVEDGKATMYVNNDGVYISKPLYVNDVEAKNITFKGFNEDGITPKDPVSYSINYDNYNTLLNPPSTTTTTTPSTT